MAAFQHLVNISLRLVFAEIPEMGYLPFTFDQQGRNCIARQCVLPARSREQAEVLHSLADLFEAVPDPRGAHGLCYDLPFLLTCLAAALLCNCDGTDTVAQWCRDHHALLRRVFGPRLASRPPVVHCIDGFCHN